MSNEPLGMPATAGKPRLAFVDNIRWTVIAMVVLLHACVTYSGMGSWYYNEGLAKGLPLIVMSFYDSFAQAFFMGILFFIAAVFIPGAYDKKGFSRFLLDRFVRLGVPTLIFMFVLSPLTNYIHERGMGAHTALVTRPLSWWLDYMRSGSFVRETGPLWFTAALLIFSIVYAMVRRIAGGARGGVTATARWPAASGRTVSMGAVCLFVIIAAGSFLVRIVQPIGSNVLNMQLGFFTQYVVLFCAGLWAARRNLILSIPRKTGALWMRLALGVGIPTWFLLFGLVSLSGPLTTIMGGLRWQAAAYAVWESFFAVAFSIGLLVCYRERFNVRNRVTGLLSDTSFGLYVFHPPFLVGASMIMRTWHVCPLEKALVAAALAWLATLGVSWLVHHTPGLRRLFA